MIPRARPDATHARNHATFQNDTSDISYRSQKKGSYMDARNLFHSLLDCPSLGLTYNRSLAKPVYLFLRQLFYVLPITSPSYVQSFTDSARSHHAREDIPSSNLKQFLSPPSIRKYDTFLYLHPFDRDGIDDVLFSLPFVPPFVRSCISTAAIDVFVQPGSKSKPTPYPTAAEGDLLPPKRYPVCLVMGPS